MRFIVAQASASKEESSQGRKKDLAEATLKFSDCALFSFPPFGSSIVHYSARMDSGTKGRVFIKAGFNKNSKIV